MNSEPRVGSLFIPRERRGTAASEGSAAFSSRAPAQPFELAVIVSRPWACGPVSCRCSR
jgi:hypothetical protein